MPLDLAAGQRPKRGNQPWPRVPWIWPLGRGQNEVTNRGPVCPGSGPSGEAKARWPTVSGCGKGERRGDGEMRGRKGDHDAKLMREAHRWRWPNDRSLGARRQRRRLRASCREPEVQKEFLRESNPRSRDPKTRNREEEWTWCSTRACTTSSSSGGGIRRPGTGRNLPRGRWMSLFWWSRNPVEVWWWRNRSSSSSKPGPASGRLLPGRLARINWDFCSRGLKRLYARTSVAASHLGKIMNKPRERPVVGLRMFLRLVIPCWLNLDAIHCYQTRCKGVSPSEGWWQLSSYPGVCLCYS